MSDFKPQEIKVSFYSNVKKNTGSDVLLEPVLLGILNGKWQKQVENYRAVLAAHGKKDPKTRAAKEALPTFTASGTFAPKRANENLAEYSQFLQIDVDRAGNSDIDFEVLRTLWYKDPYFFAIFTGPSGIENGIKGLIRVPVCKSDNEHKKVYEAARQYFEGTYNVAIDKACKDVCRSCFVSYDPDLELNFSPALFDRTVPAVIKMPAQPDFGAMVDGEHYSIRHVKSKIAASLDGAKHYTLLRMSVWLGGFVGGGQQITYDFAFGLLFDAICDRGVDDEAQAAKTIKYGLEAGAKRPIHESTEADIFTAFAAVKAPDLPGSFGTDQPPAGIPPANFPTGPKKDTPEPLTPYDAIFENALIQYQASAEAKTSVFQKNKLLRSELLNNTPYLPGVIYDTLPTILKNIITNTYTDRLRDVAFIGLLTNLSACLPHIRYWNSPKEAPKPPSLYAFVTGGPASGKGVFELMKRIGNVIDQNRCESFARALKDYIENKAAKTKKKEAITEEIPIQQFLFLTGQMTDAALIKFLGENESLMIVITEADILSGTMGGRHSVNLGAILRAIYEGESFGNTTAGEGRTLVSATRVLSMAIASTIDQLGPILGESGITGNGSFSRMIAYCYKLPSPDFKQSFFDPNELDRSNTVGMNLQKAAQYLSDISEKTTTTFYLTETQAEQARRLGQTATLSVRGLFPDSHQFSFRLMQSMYRAASLLSVLYYYEEQGKDYQFQLYTEIHPKAFRLAVIEMFPTLMDHKTIAVNYLLDQTNAEPAAPGQIKMSIIIDVIKNELTGSFSVAQLNDRVKLRGVSLSPKTLKRYLDTDLAELVTLDKSKKTHLYTLK